MRKVLDSAPFHPRGKGERVYDDPAMSSPSDDPARSATPSPEAPAPARTPGIGEDRSPNPSTCPFLRAIDEDDQLGPPIEAPDTANRCAALHEPVPQSLRQQELVCLASGHVNCPRYLRGSPPGTNEPRRRAGNRTVTPAIVVSLALFAIAFASSVGFVLANGGLVLTPAAPAPTSTGAVLGEVETAAPTAAPTPPPTPVPTAAPTASSSPSPVPSPSASPSPSLTPAVTPRPTAKPTPRPTSGRYALLTPCPNTPNCYVYVVRSGDNLFSIANYFGVSLNTVKAWNPWTQNGLVVGRGLRIPPPTR